MRKLGIKLPREEQSPRSWSLLICLDRMMVGLKADLSWSSRAEWRASERAFAVESLQCYTNWSRPRLFLKQLIHTATDLLKYFVMVNVCYCIVVIKVNLVFLDTGTINTLSKQVGTSAWKWCMLPLMQPGFTLLEIIEWKPCYSCWVSICGSSLVPNCLLMRFLAEAPAVQHKLLFLLYDPPICGLTGNEIVSIF